MSYLFESFALVLIIYTNNIMCLSLDDIHSSSITFKNMPLDETKDTALGSALDSVRRRRQEYSFNHYYGPYSLPIQASEYYKRLIPIKKQDEQVIEVPLGLSQTDSDYMDEPSSNDLFSTALALKLSQLFDKRGKKDRSVDLRVMKGINMKRKRSTSKHNNKIDKNNDFNVLKQRVEKQIRMKAGLSKTKAKRMSTRRVLEDHFKIENNKHLVGKVSHLYNNTKIPLHSNSSPKTWLNPRKNEVKSLDTKVLKKSITKRKVATQELINNNSQHNESIVKQSNRPYKTDRKVMSELTDIMKDDNSSGKLERVESKSIVKNKVNDIKSRKKYHTEQQIKTTIKSKYKRSNSGEDLDSLTLNEEKHNDVMNTNDEEINDEKSETNGGNEWETDKEDLDEWLRKEYYKNIAKTLATMRKKRSESIDMFSDDYKGDENDSLGSIEENIGEDLVTVDEGNDDEDSDDTKNLEKYMESDDDYVIAAQQDEDSNDKDIDESLIWSDNEDKDNNRKSKRSVGSFFGQMGDNIETNEISIDSERFANINNKLQEIEDTLINEALDIIRETARKGSQSESETNKVENRIDAAYNVEDMRLSLDNLRNTVNKINEENDNNDNELKDEIEITVTPINEYEVQKRSDSNSENMGSRCLSLEVLSSDCTSVANLIPNGVVKESFADACNWHEICYTCGEVFGLLSTDCDAGFLESSRLACDGSPSCESFARIVLTPLRQSRVFYKSDVPLTCYKSQCIRDYLIQTQDRKR